MPSGQVAAERCDDFGWQPRGPIDPALVADTMAHARFGMGRAWSRSSRYDLAHSPGMTYLVFTVEGAFEFTVDGSPVTAEPGTLVLLDGEAPTTAQTLAETARYVWYFEPAILQRSRSRFPFHEPILLGNASVNALFAMTNSVLNGSPPRTETARRHLGVALEHLTASALEEAGGRELRGDSRHRDGLFMAAQLAIETYFRDPSFNVTRLAKELSISVRAVHTTFSKFGTSPRREIERRRLSEVARLTSTQEASATHLVEQAGFSSVKQLRRAYARNTSGEPGRLGAARS